jgi:hypothetical protein
MISALQPFGSVASLYFVLMFLEQYHFTTIFNLSYHFGKKWIGPDALSVSGTWTAMEILLWA